MNIFILEHRKQNESLESWCTRIAESHCDQHVNKMISEAHQMLNTNRVLLGLPSASKSTAYKSHPCTVWARKTASNARFLSTLADVLDTSAKLRSGREVPHKSLTSIRMHSLGDISSVVKDTTLSPFAMAMPDNLKRKFKEDPIEGYRIYYSLYKSWFARKDPKQEGMYITYPSTWKNTSPPEWFQRTSLKRAVLGGCVVGWKGSKKIVLTKDMISNYNEFQDYKD